ncbi:hypothetical protein [Patiriisocius sp. Uisw_017]|jgi:hypothetical protein|uniref:hypothetical protein n=1 Tax=Patiriisocius sp. Uisw_017 TaxID=3230968 RepID=UPI0039EAFC8B
MGKVLCVVIGHKYILTQKVSNNINEYCCCNCNREVTNDYSVKLEVLIAKMRDVNATLSSFLEKTKIAKKTNSLFINI